MYTYTVYLKKREILIKFFQCKILCNVLYSHIRVKEQDQKDQIFFKSDKNSDFFRGQGLKSWLKLFAKFDPVYGPNPHGACNVCVCVQGGYECECEEGFYETEGVCLDMDECERSPCSPGTCTNTLGRSYQAQLSIVTSTITGPALQSYLPSPAKLSRNWHSCILSIMQVRSIAIQECRHFNML